MTKTAKMPDAPRKPDGVLTTQKGNLTLITEIFFNHDSKATFQDKLMKEIAAEETARTWKGAFDTLQRPN